MKYQFIWGIFMVAAYLGIAYLVVFTPLLIPYNSNQNTPEHDNNFVIRIVLGVILFVYGMFRGYRMWKINK